MSANSVWFTFMYIFLDKVFTVQKKTMQSCLKRTNIIQVFNNKSSIESVYTGVCNEPMTICSIWISHFHYVQLRFSESDYLQINDPITKGCNTWDLEAWRIEQILKNLINRSTGHRNFQESCIHLSPSHSSSPICKLQLVSHDHPRIWTF